MIFSNEQWPSEIQTYVCERRGFRHSASRKVWRGCDRNVSSVVSHAIPRTMTCLGSVLVTSLPPSNRTIHLIRLSEFELHLHKLNPPEHIICLEPLQICKALSSFSAPETKSSTYKDFFRCSTTSGLSLVHPQMMLNGGSQYCWRGS